jgi:predicted membrane-bound spermidine synthase
MEQENQEIGNKMFGVALVRQNPWVFFIIFLEGYVVLATEVLAMRQLIPFVGSSIEVVSIVIAGVLVPLAWGYYCGSKQRKIEAVRPCLSQNFSKAAIFLALGLSYSVIVLFFSLLEAVGIHGFLTQTILYVAAFIVYPIFLLAQTLPLLSHFLSTHHPALVAGGTLFFSTMGSFVGSLLTTLVLMNYFGVNVAAVVIVGMLCVMLLCLGESSSFQKQLAVTSLLLCALLNSGSMMKLLRVVAMTPYSLVQVFTEDSGLTRRLSINHSNSAVISTLKKRTFKYIKFIEEHYIYVSAGKRPKSILVVGGGGFSLGRKDGVNHYTFIDIDGQLQKIVERELLHRSLNKNVTFVAKSARLFMRQNKQRYDLIVLDAFTNIASLPAQLVTKEFFEAVKARLNPGGIVVFNVIVSPNFVDAFSQRLDMTFRAVFPFANREVLGAYNGWNTKGKQLDNVIYSFFDRSIEPRIYSDNRNTLAQDKRTLQN